jgi:hypothetical protein
MDAEKNKKLQQYAVALTEQAKEEERAGRSDEAIKHYLKLVDVFLVLAAEAQDHNTWVQYIRQAEAYQSMTRALIPNGQQGKQHAEGVEDGDGSLHKLNPLKKILKPFQRNEEETHDTKVPIPTQRLAVPTQQPLRTPNNPTDTVSSDVYQRVLSENKMLRDKISALTKGKDDQATTMERKCRELEAKISEMVPRADYDALQSEFDNSVSKAEYNRVKAELLNSVPKAHYDDLLNRIAEMVPRQVYLDAERRSLELEEMVKNSIPKKVIEDLASEVSLLGMLSEVPLEKVTETKEKTEVQHDEMTI